MEIRRSKSKSTLKSLFLSKLFRRRQAEVSRSRRHLNFEVFEPRHLLAAAPLALADHYSVTENAALDVLAKGVLANDTDADGDALTARLVAGPTHGTLALRNDGSFLYTPTSGYVGSDQFTYRANDGLLDSAITAVAIDVTNGPALQTGVASGITNQGWTRVTLEHGYRSMVVVATPSYQIGGTPLMARIRNATGNSFEVRVDRADGSTAAVAATDVRYTVVEEGVYTVAQHGVKMEAVKFTSTQTDFAGSWVGQQRSYANAYSNPVVVGQVMTANDADPSVFWARGASAGDIPSASQLFVGKHVGEHRDMTRANEVIGYIVIESGSGKVGNFAYVAGVGAETVQGPDNGPAATYGISGLVAVSSAVVSPAGMNGLDGGWTVLAGSNSVSTSGLQLFFEEDRWNDTERAHIAEQAAYLVFGEASAPNLRSGTVENVNSTEWTTVTLDRAYRSMVVVVTPDYAAGSAPLVARVRNATGSSFQVLVQRADTSTAPVTGIRVHYTVVEEGVYNVAQHGVKMEAFKFTSSQTDSARSWVGQQRAYANSYANPVVLGQVMSTNDPRMSVFWSRGASRTEAPTSSTLFVGKHVGEDRITMRAAEVIGYMVLETGAGSVSGLDYVAGVGASTVVGPDNGPPGLYPINGPAGAAVAIASAAGANGLDGGWAVLAGAGSISDTGLRLFIEEDNLADPERAHTTERVAYVVFAASGAPTITSTPVTSATEELAYSYDVQATDPEPGDTLTYSLLTAPAGMTINASSGLISWTPTNAQVGTQSVTVRVQDTDLAQATQSFTITVANTNDPPSIISTPVTSATEDSLYSYDVNASDPDVGDTLTYSLTTAPSGMTINASTGLISWTPTNVQVGSHSVTVRVQDAALAQATQSFTVSVLNANDPPTITSTPVTVATEDAAYSYDVNATDPDAGDTLTYSLTTAPTGMTINASSGVISWTPTNAQVGANSVTVRVQDAGLAAATQSFTVTVANTNDAPDITSTPVTSATALLRYNYDVEATDPDVGDTLTYSLTVAPAGMTINSSTGLISWTPTVGQVGSHTVTVRVQDAATSYDTQSFSVEVADASQAVPHVRTGQLLNVGNMAWTKVTLDRAYSSMVVVTTPSYAAGNPPVVTRVRNAVGDSFEVQVQRVDGSTAALSGITVYYTVVEEGVYTQAVHGVTMEAVKYNSTVTDSDSSWVGEARGYHNSYSAPVVLGQVMTTNDTRFSEFWSRGASRTEIPTANSLYVGKHVGEDPVVTRATEVVGYIVIESGAGAIGSLSYVAGVGAGTVVGPDNSPPVTYATNGPADATVAVLSASGAVGLDGGWAVLAGANSVTSSALRLFIEEDNLLDAERLHVAERVAYLMFPPTNGPKITSDPVTSATEDAPYSYDVNAVDPDPGDTLNYSLVSGPSGMAIDSATGLISWTPTNSQVGANMVTVLVSDSNAATATQTFKITVANTNDRPIITSTPVTTATEDAAYSYDVNATDPDVGDTLTYSLGTAPTGMTINSTTGVISWTPTNAQVGLNSVMVRVRDAALAETTQSFTIAVANTNDAPTITSTPVTTATEDSVYSYDVNATDPDLGDTLTYALTTAPTGMTINTSTGMISWTPTNAQVGSHSVTVRVRDVALAQATQTFTVTVANVNDTPTITSTPITTATEDSAYSYDVNATDVDAGDTLTYALTTAPTGMTINATTGMISWTPTNAQVGANSVTVRVRDVALAEATQSFTVTVANTNDAATITSTPVTAATEDSAYSYDVNATDPDVGDTLAYALTTAPTGMSINTSTGVISWTPTNAQVGSHSVTVRVRDVALAQATQTFTVTVANVNDAPTITSTPVTAATEDAAYSYDVNATDVDAGDTLTYALTVAPTGMTINATTGVISWTPTNAQVGANSVTVRVRDVALAEATQSFTVTVANTNDAPTITSTPVTTGSVGAAYTYDVNATDPDVGDTLTYALTTAPTGMTINATTGVISWTPTLAQVGSQSVTVRVRDVALAQATQTFSVTVTDSNHAPVAANDTYSATESTTLTVAAAGVLANDTDSDSDPLTAVLVAGPSHGTLTLNANGSFTYTPTTGFTGTDSFTYKASDGEANSNVATVNLMVNPVNTVLITAAWLAAQGAGPYLLTQANTNYVLQTDVTVDGTAFVVGEANITLDLNGHTVTYGNAAPVVVNNGGFEVGSGRNVPGWDLSGAPNAAIAPNTMYMWGEQVLTLTNFTGTQTIISAPIVLAQAGHEYAATITPIGPSDATVKLSIVDATTQQVLGTANSDAVNRGFAAVVKFALASSTTVILKVEVTAASGKTQTVSLDYASLTPSRDYGISATPSPWYWPDQLKNNSAAYSAAGKAKAFTVRNGMIVQGQSKSYTGNAIHAQSLNGLTVRDLGIRVNGIDTAAIYGQWISGAAIIDGNTIQSTVDKVTNRMHVGGMLSFNSVSGTFAITNNTILDHPKSGIELIGGQGHTISHNTIDSNAIVTNCYGILVTGIQHSTIHHNTIVTQRSGRGILVDGLTGDTQDTVDLEIYNNTIDVRERANLEYGTGGIEATALRLRSYRDGGHRDLNIHDNSFVARTGVGNAHGAIGTRISYMNNASAIEWGDVISNNLFKAIVDTTDSYYWARAIAIEGVVSGTGLKFFGNAIESNDISLGLSGNDGFYAHDVTFTSSTFVKSSEGASRTYQTVRAGDNNGDVDTVYLIDSRYEGGASEGVTFVGTGVKEVLIGWSLDVVVRNSSGGLLAGAIVEVRDKDLNVVWSGSTSPSGDIQDISVVTKCLRQSASAAMTVDSRGPHRVRVSLNGYDTKDIQVSLDSSTTLDVTLL
jgi:VCBS repeat-containing protein